MSHYFAIHKPCALILTLLLVLVMLSPGAAAEEQDGVMLNLDEAPIESLIELVSEATGRNFIIDPRVDARVTVVSARPLDPHALYETFLSILAVHGYAAVPSGEVTRIVPASEAIQQGADAPTPGDHGRGEPVTQVINPEHISASQLVPVLRPLVGSDAHLAAYEPANMLILSDHRDNVERMLKLIDRIDQASDEEIETVALEYANAEDVASTLASVRGEGEHQDARIMPDTRTNSIILAGSEDQRLQLRAVIAHLDIPTEDTGNTQVIYLRHAEAEALAGVLDSIELPGARGENDAAQTLTIVPDPETNALVVTAPPEDMRSIRTVVNQLDIRRAQVLVEAIIAEITSDRATELGVQWVVDATEQGVGAGLVNFSGSGAPILGFADIEGTEGLEGGLDGATLGIGRREDDGRADFAALLRALQGDTATNIISTPMLVTMDNEEAEINVGQEVPFLTGQFSERGTGTGDGVNPFQTIDRQDVGVQLVITPRINEGDAVELQIEQEISSLTEQADAVDVVTDTRSINTRVIAEDGQIIVLGGLIDDDVQETTQRVPILGSIPVVGRLFRSDTTDRSKRNLMVFIRPDILRDGMDSARYSARYYDELREMQIARADEHDRLPGLARHRLGGMLPEYRHDAATSVQPVHEELQEVLED